MNRSTPKNLSSNESLTANPRKGGIMIKEIQSTRKPRPKDKEDPNNTVVPPAPPSEAEEKNAQIIQPEPKKKTTKSPLKKSPLKVPTVPTEQPKNVYELERIWRGLKAHPHLFAKYVITLKNSTIKKVFNDNVSSDLFSSLFEVCGTHIVKESPKDAFRVLECLTMMKGFALTASLWPQKDMQNIEEIFSEVFSSGTVAPEKITALKGVYLK